MLLSESWECVLLPISVSSAFSGSLKWITLKKADGGIISETISPIITTISLLCKNLNFSIDYLKSLSSSHYGHVYTTDDLNLFISATRSQLKVIALIQPSCFDLTHHIISALNVPNTYWRRKKLSKTTAAASCDFLNIRCSVFDSCLWPPVNVHVRRSARFIALYFAVGFCLPEQHKYVEKSAF